MHGERAVAASMFPGGFFENNYASTSLASRNRRGEACVSCADYNYLSPYLLIHVVLSYIRCFRWRIIVGMPKDAAYLLGHEGEYRGA